MSDAMLYSEPLPGMKKPTKCVCAFCGNVVWYDLSHNRKFRKYCSDRCLHAAYYHRNKEVLKAKGKRKKRGKRMEASLVEVRKTLDCIHDPIPKPKESIAEINAKAKASGITYGEYVANQYKEQMKVRRAD